MRRSRGWLWSASVGWISLSCEDTARCGTDFDGGASLHGGVAIDVVDPQCVDKPWRNKETAGGCGLGAELALVLPLLGRMARRSRIANWRESDDVSI